MKKIILLCTIIMISCYACNLEEIQKVPTSIEGYEVNMPQISTNPIMTKAQLEQKFKTVEKQESWETIIIKASSPKDKYPLFNTITYIYNLEKDVFKSVNVCVTYAPLDMDAKAKEYSQSKLKELSLIQL